MNMSFFNEEVQASLLEFGEEVIEQVEATMCAGAAMAVEAGPEAMRRIMALGEFLIWLKSGNKFYELASFQHPIFQFYLHL